LCIEHSSIVCAAVDVLRLFALAMIAAMAAAAFTMTVAAAVAVGGGDDDIWRLGPWRRRPYCMTTIGARRMGY
jgi:hypothetical protein